MPTNSQFTVELINTGSELMLGRVLNTHQQWLCGRLADLGYVVTRQVAVPDTGPDIQQALREALGRADLIITTGGLGPTSDDLTREFVARLVGRKLQLDKSILGRIEHFFESRKRPMPASVGVQALVPEGAQVLANPHGTAPGLAMVVDPNPFHPTGRKSCIIMLPGPPRELRPVFTEVVTPLLGKWLPVAEPFVCRTLRTTGIGESMAEEKIGRLLEPLAAAGLTVGYCARPGQVDIRLTASGVSAQVTVDEAAEIVRLQLGSHLYTETDDELEEVLIRLLTCRDETLAVAESCTGGCIANRLTNVSGASAVFLAGLVTYSNAAKSTCLGVKTATLDEYGAVSEAVAREMAEGARAVAGATYALSTTGIAGPTGGTPTKPVGTVFIGLAGPFPTVVVRNFNPVDRETFKQMTAQQALELLRQAVLKHG